MKRKMQACTLLLAMLFPIGALLSQNRGDAESVKKGHTLYVQYCVSCHGEEGRGDGPAASALKTRPPDLSTISKRDKGFSQEKVRDQISGEKFVVGHGLREMPVWGKRLRDEEGAQKAAGDLHSLTVYLRSIQQN
jgi:mono/diheme cytochrome c family protein